MESRQRILIIDDELGPREALRMILKGRYTTMTASSGPEGLALVQQTPPDLVFLDIKMPGMSGIEVLKAIKQRDANIEVIMMTAYASLDTAREAMAHSASEYLIKPFTKADVEKAVDKALTRRAEHTGSHQEMRALLEQMRTLTSATQHHEPAHDFLDKATVILEQGKQTLHAAAALLHVQDAMRHTLQGQVTLGTPSHLQTTFEGTAWHGVLTQALTQRQALRLPGVSPAAPAAGMGQSLRTLGWAASTLFPIMVGEQALGVLVFLYNDVPEVRADWHTLGQAFADLMAFAMQAYERYCASQLEASQQAQRVAQLNILRELTRVLMETLDLSDMLQAMGTQLQAGLGYAGVSVWLYRTESPSMQQVYRCGAHSGWQPELSDPIPFQVERVKNVQVIRAPIVLQGQTIGAVEFVRGPQYGSIAAFERELIQMVLDYLGMAVKNSRLYGEIKTTKQYLEHLINDAGDAIVTVDTTDTVTSWNASAARIFQYQPVEILQQPIWTLFPREQYSAWRDEVLQQGTVKHLETRLCQQNGTPVEVSLTVSPLRGVYDEIVGFSAIIRDVTEEKHLREQLMQAEKLRALGEMAAGVAHNFNNILTTILGHTQLLLEDLEGDRVAQEGLRTIEKTTKDAAQVVQRIQRFAKGKSAGPYHPTDVTLLIKEVIEATRPVWKEQAEYQGKGIALVFDPEPLPYVPCRAAEIREVLTNLILNGVDAMPSGGTLSMHTYQDGQFACIAVADTGTGMPADVRRRIFDPFFTTKKEKGTGLGLSVSHTLIKGHGGDIEVQSTPGQGTTFVVKLPLQAVAVLEDEE